MNRRVRGVLVAHAELATALVRAVERISGVRDAVVPVSNEGCDPSELERRVRRAAGAGPALVFVDMSSGSCAFAGRRVGRGRSEIAVVTGVNLPMVLDFVFHRDMELPRLAERVAGKGGVAIEAHHDARGDEVPPDAGDAPERRGGPPDGTAEGTGG